MHIFVDCFNFVGAANFDEFSESESAGLGACRNVACRVFLANVSMRHCLQTESALPSSWNAIISVFDYMGTLKQYCEKNLFWFEMRAEFFFQGNAGSLQTLGNICEAFYS